jgi:hypothetical protein
MFVRVLITIVAIGLMSWLAVGCASGQRKLSYVDSDGGRMAHDVHPIITGSINGVSGHFLIDTGASGQFLSMTAVRRCGITVTPSQRFSVDAWGNRIAMMVATNITVKFSHDVEIRWPLVMVLTSTNEDSIDQDYFGILDYETLESAHAVLDTRHKTLIIGK